MKNNNRYCYNTEDPANIISRTYGTNELINLYFSDINRDEIQNDIQKWIYFNSYNNLKIGRQSDTELKIIMKSIYLTNRSKLTDYRDVLQQVKFLNKLVIQECCKIIKTNISQHLHYVNNLDSEWKNTMNLPVNLSSKGTKTLELYK